MGGVVVVGVGVGVGVGVKGPGLGLTSPSIGNEEKGKISMGDVIAHWSSTW